MSSRPLPRGISCIFNFQVKPTYHREFVRSLRFSLNHICSYRQLEFEAEYVRKMKFNSSDPNHVKKLHILWESLRDDPIEGEFRYHPLKPREFPPDFRSSSMEGMWVGPFSNIMTTLPMTRGSLCRACFEAMARHRLPRR